LLSRNMNGLNDCALTWHWHGDGFNLARFRFFCCSGLLWLESMNFTW